LVWLSCARPDSCTTVQICRPCSPHGAKRNTGRLPRISLRSIRATRSLGRNSQMVAVASRNIKFISHSDQGGRGDGVQVMVHRGFAYIGHGFSNGIAVVDVRDPKHPKTVNFLACPPNTRAHHLQTHGDLLLAVNGPSIWT